MSPTMMKNTLFACLCSLGLVLLGVGVGCGDSDESRPRYDSGQSGDTNVSMLDDTQRMQLCESYDAYVNTYVSLDAVAYLACLPAAIWTTTTTEACNASLQNCLSLFPRPIQVSARAESREMCEGTLNQCQASVAQLEGCINVNIDVALQVYDQWSCDRVNDPEVRDMAAPNGGLVSVCSDIDSACNRFATVNGPD